MAQYAYIARASSGSPTNTPLAQSGNLLNWVFGWVYPGDGDNNAYPTSPISGGNIPGVPWPPLWPPAIIVGTTVVVEVTAHISKTTHSATVESYVLVNASETAATVYNHHLLQLTCSEVGATRQLRKSGGPGYTDSIAYQVTNYAGNRWGFSATVDFDPSQWAVLDLIDIQSKLITAVANPSGADQWDVIS